MRPIDADVLLEKMKRRRDFVGRASDPVCLVEDAPTVGGWVSVKERPPEDENECIVVIEGKWIWIGWFHGSKEEWIVDGVSCANGYVTHWMAIPDLPEEK